jgi:hypothetical protein
MTTKKTKGGKRTRGGKVTRLSSDKMAMSHNKDNNKMNGDSVFLLAWCFRIKRMNKIHFSFFTDNS